MSGISKGTAVIGVVLAALIVGGLIGWLASRGPTDAITPAQPTIPATTPALPSRNRDSASSRVASGSGPSAMETNSGVQHLPAMNTTVAAAGALTDWENRLEAITEAKVPNVEKAKQIAALFSRFPQEGQVDAAELMTDLLPDAEYALAAQILTNAAISEPVLDVLIADLLGRPEKLKLPLLLDVARTPTHAKAEEARDFLELFLEHDYGDDWSKWEKAMEDWLKANPE